MQTSQFTRAYGAPLAELPIHRTGLVDESLQPARTCPDRLALWPDCSSLSVRRDALSQFLSDILLVLVNASLPIARTYPDRSAVEMPAAPVQSFDDLDDSASSLK